MPDINKLYVEIVGVPKKGGIINVRLMGYQIRKVQFNICVCTLLLRGGALQTGNSSNREAAYISGCSK